MAMILDSFMGKCAELLTSFIEEEAVMLLGVKDELKKLQRRIVWIQNLLEDAEKRKFEDSAINQWLRELKDAMYDADDIIDLCRIEGAQLLADQPSKQKNPTVCCNFPGLSCFTSVPFRHKIGLRIKELNDKLRQIHEYRNLYKLAESTKPANQITRVDVRQTSPMTDSDIVGRKIEEATDDLVKLLTNVQGRKSSLVAITGMGGVGKTTLAQKIFNHQKIKIDFKLKIWVCVSQTYSETGLLQLVIREAGGSYGDAKTKSELQTMLKSAISSKTLFLVLDDVWREDVWIDLFRIPLQSAETIVRILVTTRDDDVAGKMTASIHHVTELSVDEGWEMLYRRLLSGREEEEISSLKQIGIQITEKCGCLPLAIKAIAGVLAGKERNQKEWEKVLRNNAWSMSQLPDELRGALYLSYDDLPSHLKQCFLYCCLYPEDANVSRGTIKRLWIAEGFIKEQQDSASDDQFLEDFADDYYDELVSRNLLQSDSSKSTYKMHDLFRSLAQFLSKDESFCGFGITQYKPTSTKLRRLSLFASYELVIFADEQNLAQMTSELLNLLRDQRSIRTLLASYVPVPLDNNQLDRIACLRVLEITFLKLRSIPSAIGDLIHLRYLNLDGTEINEIPESIERLSNLQFLSLRACTFLTALPAGITKLQNLRRLGLYNTPLNFIPKGIQKMQQLNDLSGFVVADTDITASQTAEPQGFLSSELEELNFLKKLRKVTISRLERAQTGAVILKELPHLFDLKLFCTSGRIYTEDDINRVEKLFNELTPPGRLEELQIRGFFGLAYPSWMSSTCIGECLTLLTRMELVDITSCTHLPPLGQLPKLKFLYISGFSAVKTIGPEFLGGGVPATRIAFPKLEVLKIRNMYNLEEWSFGEDVEEFDENGQQKSSPRLRLMPCLHKIVIKDCQWLRQLPKGLRHTAMKVLYVEEASCLEAVENLPCQIEVLELVENESLILISHFAELRKLIVRNCPALAQVEQIAGLQELKYVDDEWLNSLPEWLLKLLQQRQLPSDKNDDFLLQLECMETALRGCLKGGAYWDFIEKVPRVIANENFGKGYLHYTRQPYIYDTNLIE